jgi:hypothetical protein
MITKKLMFNISFFLLNLFIVALFHQNIPLSTVILIAVAIIGLYYWKSRATLIIFIIVGLFGPIAEMIAVNSGAWTYTLANIANVPLWLFPLWGNAAAFIYQTVLEIKKVWKIKK